MAWPDPQLGLIRPRHLLVLLALGGLALPAGARTYCCNDDGGRRLCGDILPPQCATRAYQEYNAMGVMYRQHEAPLTAEQRARREAELARQKEAAREAAEEDRRNRALLASYPSVQDIDIKRARTLEEFSKSLREMRSRQEAALLRQQELAREAEFFQKRPMPDALKSSMRDNAAELLRLQADIETKNKEIAEVEARFDAEKKRYLSLGKGGAAPGASPEAGAARSGRP
jgi:hypothetical protein